MGNEDIITPNMAANIVQFLQNKETNEEKDAKRPKITDKGSLTDGILQIYR
jgi:hypothetical protein